MENCDRLSIHFLEFSIILVSQWRVASVAACCGPTRRFVVALPTQRDGEVVTVHSEASTAEMSVGRAILPALPADGGLGFPTKSGVRSPEVLAPSSLPVR